jgi:hypothetical protein
MARAVRSGSGRLRSVLRPENNLDKEASAMVGCARRLRPTYAFSNVGHPSREETLVKGEEALVSERGEQP